MLSRAATNRGGLVCSDCGEPALSLRPSGKPHPIATTLVLSGLAAFSVLLVVLTNWRTVETRQTADRHLIRSITTGAYVRDAELLDKGGHSE